MSSVVANLDAAIAAYRAEQEQIDRVLRLFGRDWTLLPDVSTATLNPILQVQAMAEEAKTDEQQNSVGLRALTALQETIVGTVIEEQRPELRKALTEIGFPLGALETIMEQVLEVFSAAPLSTPAPNESRTTTPDVPAESTTDSGKSSTPDGPISSDHSTPLPPVPAPTPAQPQDPIGQGLRQREQTPEVAPVQDERWVQA